MVKGDTGIHNQVVGKTYVASSLLADRLRLPWETQVHSHTQSKICVAVFDAQTSAKSA